MYGPALWFLAAASMTAGNLMALRQKNIVRLMAYSGIAQAGFILAPLAIAGVSTISADTAVSAVLTYLVIYAAMNLGVFAVIMTVARRTGTGDVASYNGLFRVSPGIAVVMTVFLASLAGVPPAGGWYAKFAVFQALVSAGTPAAYVLAGFGAVNAVIAVGYYGKIAARMWFEKPAEALGQEGRIAVPFSLRSALGLTVAATLVFGIVPATVTRFTDVSLLAVAVGG